MEENLIAGIVLFVVSFCGVLFNSTVVLCQKRVLNLKQSFGSFTRNQAVGDAIQSITVFFLVAPMVILRIDFLLYHSNLLSFATLLGYEVSVLSHVLLTANRFCAVFAPIKYNTIFSEDRSAWMTLFVDIYAALSCAFFYICDCRYYWNSDEWVFMYHQSNQCDSISFYGIFCKYFAIIVLVLLTDLVTAYKASRLWRSLPNSQQQRSREVSFLVQICLQGLLFGTELVAYFLVSPHVGNKWICFMLTSFMFCFIHACDGALSIFCNKDFRRFLRELLLCHAKQRMGSQSRTV